MARDLNRLAEEARSLKIYVTPLDPPTALRDPRLFAQAIGLPQWPGPVDEQGYRGETKGGGEQGREPSASGLGLYRFLGLQRDQLDCDSAVIIFASLQTTPEGNCGEDEVFSALVPRDANIPFVEINWGDNAVQPVQTLGERMRLVLSNHASIDLWVEWKRDTHQAPQTDFLPHGSTKERKSRRVSVFDGAFFEIVVRKNAGGVPGEEIGHFTDNVFGRDHVEFIVTNIGGRTYFQAVSLVTIGKILLSVLL